MPLDVASRRHSFGELPSTWLRRIGQKRHYTAWDRPEESNAPMNSIKWAANLDGVREVSLWGTAEKAYWCDYLASEGLVPDELDGKARIMIVAAEGRFHEPAVSRNQFLSRNRVTGPTVRACRISVTSLQLSQVFAFCERVFFSTPYRQGNVTVSCESQPLAKLSVANNILFHAELGRREQTETHRTTEVAASAWQGPVYLPAKKQKEAQGKNRKGVFVARIGGETTTVPFSPKYDVLTIDADRRSPATQMLRASGFAPLYWEIRRSANHAKSKTMTRNQLAQTSVPRLPIT